ncbi:MAG: carbohydrate ABC transporter substrate-binding protein [Geodermatophilaceae bacterium]|nr:carbohydrate ABC transporter substrate-binding protein [Geodermatophilaceae bacterium]
MTAGAAALALMLAGCGGGDSGGSSDTNAPSAGALDGETIELASVLSGAEQDAMEQVLAGFTDQTGAEVTFTSTGDDISTVLGTRIAGGDPPDVALLPQPGLLKQLVADGSLQPLSDEVSAAVDENYGAVWKDLGSVDGTLYGVWFKSANKSTVWYRQTAFDDAGASVPEDFDAFVDTLSTIGDSGVTPLSVDGASGWTLTDWFENVYLRVAGPDMYDQLTAHEIPWTDPSVITTLETLASVWGSDNLVGGTSGALAAEFPESVTTTFGDAAEGGVLFEGDFVAGVIGDSTNAVVGEDANFFPFPSIDGSPESVVGGGDVAVALTDSPAAMALVQYLATPEAAEIWAAIGGYISPNSNVDSSVYPDDTTKSIAEALVGAGDNFRFDMSDQMPTAFGGTPGAGEWAILQNFLADPTTVDATAAALEAAATAAYGA